MENSFDKVREWRKDEEKKTISEKHKFALKISILLTFLVVVVLSINWYMTITGAVPNFVSVGSQMVQNSGPIGILKNIFFNN